MGVSEGGRVRFRLRYDGTVVVEYGKNYKELSGKLNNYAGSSPVDAYSLREKIADERAKELGY